MVGETPITTRDIIEADPDEAGWGEGWEDLTWVLESTATWYRDRCVELEAQIERLKDEVSRVNRARMMGI